MEIKQSEYPNLFQERVWSWGPVKTVFELGEPPRHLVSNVNIVPFDDTGWLIIRDQLGWGIVGGTVEPSESYVGQVLKVLQKFSWPELIPVTS